MRHFLQLQIFAQFTEIDQHLHQTSVVGLEKGLKNSQGKELMLCEIMP